MIDFKGGRGKKTCLTNIIELFMPFPVPQTNLRKITVSSYLIVLFLFEKQTG